jgi:hypothetical protein
MPRTKASDATVELAVPNVSEAMKSGPATEAMIAPMMERLTACPTKRMVDRVPEATPKRFLSTHPITALVLGDENMPMPIPSTNSPAAMYKTWEVVVRVLMNSRPNATIAMPVEDRKREPIRSEAQPDIGDRTAITKGMVRSTRPV